MSRPAGSAGGTTPGTRRRGLGGHTLPQIVFCDTEIVDEALRSMGRSVWQHCNSHPSCSRGYATAMRTRPCWTGRSSRRLSEMLRLATKNMAAMKAHKERRGIASGGTVLLAALRTLPLGGDGSRRSPRFCSSTSNLLFGPPANTGGFLTVTAKCGPAEGKLKPRPTLTRRLVSKGSSRAERLTGREGLAFQPLQQHRGLVRTQ